MSKIYQEPKNYSIEMVNDCIFNHKSDKAAEAIIGLSLYSEDRQELQYFILNILNNSEDIDIKNACIKALSHIVRIDREIDDKVFSIIEELKENHLFSANIEDLIDDIEVYFKNKNVY